MDPPPDNPPPDKPPPDNPPPDNPPPDNPPPDRPKFRSFFSLLPPPFWSFCVSLGVLSLNFGGVFEGRSCETPAAPPDRAAGARTRQPENSKRAHFRAPALQTPPKFHAKTPRERKKKENCGGKRGKKTRNFGPPTLRGSTLRAPLFLGLGLHPLRGLRPSGPPPFGASTLGAPLFLGLGLHPFRPTLRGPTLCRPKIQHPKIGRSRNWPKSNLPNSKKRAGRSRNWPKSIAIVVGSVGKPHRPFPPTEKLGDSMLGDIPVDGVGMLTPTLSSWTKRKVCDCMIADVGSKTAGTVGTPTGLLLRTDGRVV